MSLNAVDKKAIKDFLPYWGVDKKEAIAEYTKAKAKAIEQFGDDDEKKTAARAVQIASVVIRPKSYRIGSGKPYKAILLASTKARDMWGRKRELQMKKYQDLKEQGKENQAYADKIVMLDKKSGVVIPLCPQTKADGTKSKVAGEPMPSPEDSMIQQVIGITYVEEKGKLKPVGFTGTTRGSTCVTEGFDQDAVYEFIGSGEADKKTGLLKLNVNSDFKKVDDDYLTEGKAKLGIHKMTEKLFKHLIVRQSDLSGFAAVGEIPGQMRDFVIVKEATIPFYNPKPNNKGNIRIQFENKQDLDSPPGADADSTMGMVDANKVVIDFGQGTNAMLIGDAWIAKGDDQRTVMNVAAIIPYPGEIIETAPKDTKDLPDDEVDEEEDDTPADTPTEEPVAKEEPAAEEEAVEEEAEEEDDDVWASD